MNMARTENKVGSGKGENWGARCGAAKYPDKCNEIDKHIDSNIYIRRYPGMPKHRQGEGFRQSDGHSKGRASSEKTQRSDNEVEATVFASTGDNSSIVGPRSLASSGLGTSFGEDSNSNDEESSVGSFDNQLLAAARSGVRNDHSPHKTKVIKLKPRQQLLPEDLDLPVQLALLFLYTFLSLYTLVILLEGLFMPKDHNWCPYGEQTNGLTYDNPDHNNHLCHYYRLPQLLFLSKDECDKGRRLLASVIYGGIIGYERKSADRPAGIRTMALVSLGSCFFTLSSQFCFKSSTMGWDAARVSAAIPSGVGFLGGALIWKGTTGLKGSPDEKHEVHGLTTAAAVWLSAAVGVGAGGRLYVVASFCVVLTIVVLRMGPRMYLLPDISEEGSNYDEAGDLAFAQAPASEGFMRDWDSEYSLNNDDDKLKKSVVPRDAPSKIYLDHEGAQGEEESAFTFGDGDDNGSQQPLLSRTDPQMIASPPPPPASTEKTPIASPSKHFLLTEEQSNLKEDHDLNDNNKDQGPIMGRYGALGKADPRAPISTSIVAEDITPHKARPPSQENPLEQPMFSTRSDGVLERRSQRQLSVRTSNSSKHQHQEEEQQSQRARADSPLNHRKSVRKLVIPSFHS